MNPYEPTDTAPSEDSDQVEIMVLRRIGVFSAFRILGVLYGALAGVFGVLYGLGIAAFSVLAAAQGESAALVGLAVAVAVVVFVPIFYGVIGGAFGALAAFVYNLAAGRFGGLEMSFGSIESAR